MADDRSRPGVDASGRIVVPSALAAHIGTLDGDELVVEAVPDGVLVTVDRLRKVYVEATGQCNLRCTMCPRQAWAGSAGHMTDRCFGALLAGLPDAAPGGVTLAFGGFGEPTIHPGFLDMVAGARHAGRRVELITNGTTMSALLAQQLAELGVAQVTVSIDGGEDDAYRAMRGAERGPVVEAVAMLREHARRGAGRMSVGIACVLTRQNAASLPALVEAAMRVRADFVSISNIVPHTRALAESALCEHATQVSNMRPESWRPRLSIGRFDLNGRTRPLLEALLKPLPVIPPPAFDRGEWHNHCRFVREGMVAVSWDGRVAPCLSLLYDHTEHLGGRDKTVRAFEVGRVESGPLRDIWRDAGFRAFRAQVRKFDTSPCLSCGGCDISETNEGDCFGTPFPACSECLWAQGLVLCP